MLKHSLIVAFLGMFSYLYTMSKEVKKTLIKEVKKQKLANSSIAETNKTGTAGLLDKVKELCKDLPITSNEFNILAIKVAYESHVQQIIDASKK